MTKHPPAKPQSLLERNAATSANSEASRRAVLAARAGTQRVSIRTSEPSGTLERTWKLSDKAGTHTDHRWTGHTMTVDGPLGGMDGKEELPIAAGITAHDMKDGPILIGTGVTAHGSRPKQEESLLSVSGPVAQPADETHARCFTSGCLRIQRNHGRCNGTEMISSRLLNKSSLFRHFMLCAV